MSDTIDAGQNGRQPNFVAVPLEDFQGAISFINQSLPTGLGVPLLERLGRNIGLHIPAENLPPNFYPAQVEAPADDGVQAVVNDLDRIGEVLEPDRPAKAARRR